MQRSEGVIFRSDDGRTLDEADVRALALHCDHCTIWRADRDSTAVAILAALDPKPKTCGAVMRVGDYLDLVGQRQIPCVLPPGHHPYAPEVHSGTCNALAVTGGRERRCSKVLTDLIHSPGHMPSADSWVVPNG